MKKNIVKINESALRGIIAKSVRKALKEGIGDEAVRGLFGKTSDEGRGTFSEIDNALQERGIDAYVSKFFSDEGRVMVMVKSHENDGEIKDILSQFGYGECIGQGVDWIQFTKGESAVNESKKDKDMKKNIVKINENTLKQIIAESVKRILKESLDSSIRIDDKNRVFDAFKSLIHAMIWENGNIGGEETILDDAENKYLQEYGERDLEMLWNNVQKYTWDIVGKQMNESCMQ